MLILTILTTLIFITSPAGTAVKCCHEYVCGSVGLPVCLSVCLVCLSAWIFPKTARDLCHIFVHAACVRGSVLLGHDYDRSHRLSPGSSFLPLKMHYRPGKEEWECTARAGYAIYDCLVILAICTCLTFVFYCTNPVFGCKISINFFSSDRIDFVGANEWGPGV